MLSQRSRPLAGLAAICAAVTVTACSALGDTDAADGGPPRISPEPRPDIAAAMVDDVLEPQERLDTCGLLDLTAEEVIELTDAAMPVVAPTGLDELGMPCTYGGPGSPERLMAELEAALEAAEDEAEEGAGSEAEAGTEAGVETPGATTTEGPADQAAEEAAGEPAAPEAPMPVGPTTPGTAEPGTTEPDAETDTAEPDAAELDPLPREGVPTADTVAAGMVKPRSGAPEALATQPVMLGSRYACSEVRGQDAESVPGEVAGVPEAPGPVSPELATPYIDCIAAPTGGGVEVHTIFVADNDLWHLTFVRPGTPRSPEADAEALEGLHRVAEHVLA